MRANEREIHVAVKPGGRSHKERNVGSIRSRVHCGAQAAYSRQPALNPSVPRRPLVGSEQLLDIGGNGIHLALRYNLWSSMTANATYFACFPEEDVNMSGYLYGWNHSALTSVAGVIPAESEGEVAFHTFVRILLIP